MDYRLEKEPLPTNRSRFRQACLSGRSQLSGHGGARWNDTAQLNRTYSRIDLSVKWRGLDKYHCEQRCALTR